MSPSFVTNDANVPAQRTSATQPEQASVRPFTSEMQWRPSFANPRACRKYGHYRANCSYRHTTDQQKATCLQ